MTSPEGKNISKSGSSGLIQRLISSLTGSSGNGPSELNDAAANFGLPYLNPKGGN